MVSSPATSRKLLILRRANLKLLPTMDPPAAGRHSVVTHSAIPSMKGSVNSVLNFLALVFSGCAALSMVSGEFGRGSCKKRCYKKYVRSCYVYENKQISDKMPARNSDIYSLVSDIYV